MRAEPINFHGQKPVKKGHGLHGRCITKKKPRLLFLVSEDWYFCSHRFDLALMAQQRGFEVIVVTQVSQYAEKIQKAGFQLIPIRMKRGSCNPWHELGIVFKLIRLYRRVRPDIVHHVSIKPVLYGSWAARMARVPAVVNALTGLGYIFIRDGCIAKIQRALVKTLFKTALNLKNSRVILQNPDDADLLVREHIIHPHRVEIIRGAGVDLVAFQPVPEPPGDITVLLPARMLWDKGVGEFVAAIRLLKAWDVSARFILAGMIDRENPSGIPEQQLRAWQEEGLVEYVGHQQDIRKFYDSCHIVVLPSYREGLPKVLLEAAACGRPIVATDVPGCREIVRTGENGFLVPARDYQVLSKALQTLIKNVALRARMGRCGRSLVEEEFSKDKIGEKTLNVYTQLLEQEGHNYQMELTAKA